MRPITHTRAKEPESEAIHFLPFRAADVHLYKLKHFARLALSGPACVAETSK
jgi:hypothetical protein